jgi:hypothetical protein
MAVIIRKYSFPLDRSVFIFHLMPLLYRATSLVLQPKDPLTTSENKERH